MQQRNGDITPLTGRSFEILINEEPVKVVEGETILSAMFSMGIRNIMSNDHRVACGAYCGMGVCHCCHVKVDGKYKQRACKTVVKQGMEVVTKANRFQDVGISD